MSFYAPNCRRQNRCGCNESFSCRICENPFITGFEPNFPDVLLPIAPEFVPQLRQNAYYNNLIGGVFTTNSVVPTTNELFNNMIFNVRVQGNDLLLSPGVYDITYGVVVTNTSNLTSPIIFGLESNSSALDRGQISLGNDQLGTITRNIVMNISSNTLLHIVNNSAGSVTVNNAFINIRKIR